MSKARAIVSFPSGRRGKWVVLILWIIILAVAGSLAGKLTGAERNDAQSWLPAQAQSTKVLALQSKFQSPNVFSAVVVYDRPAGLTAADRAKAASDAAKFKTISGVVRGQVSGPFFARDGQAIETVVPVNLGKNGWNEAGKAADAIRGVAQANAQGLAVHIAGPLGTAADSAKSFKGINGTLLFATLAIVIVLLLITYRSPVLWLLPVISAAVALTSAEALIYLLAAHAGLTVNAQSAGILDVLVFGAGTDYALNSTKGLGPVLAIGVAVALLAMMTLLPALLVIVGRWVFWPARPTYGSAEPTSRGIWARVGRGIAVRPRVVWVATAVVLGAMALGLTGLKASGLTNAQSFRGHPDSVTGQTILDQHFAGGSGQPVVVVGNQAAAARLEAAFKATPGITGVTPPVTRAGHAYLDGTLTTAPDSQAAYATVDRVRANVQAVPGADALVGGNTAINLDVQGAAAHDRNVIIPVVLAVVFVILALLLRAVIAPLMLMATVVLSFAAALGVSALMFNNVFNFGGADTSFPLFVFVFLVALGIDYNIFLMTRVREEAKRHGTRRGALTGLAVTGGVITSAGAVLAGTFAVLGTLPVTFLTELGFAVAFGVLLDTIVVRSVLVTALNLDLGRWLWWPSRLARDRVHEDQAAIAGQPTGAR